MQFMELFFVTSFCSLWGRIGDAPFIFCFSIFLFLSVPVLEAIMPAIHHTGNYGSNNPENFREHLCYPLLKPALYQLVIRPFPLTATRVATAVGVLRRVKDSNPCTDTGVQLSRLPHYHSANSPLCE